MIVSQETYDWLLTRLEEPPEPNERLRKLMSQRVCGCVRGHRGDWWKHAGSDGTPETALCEPFGGCSHPCPHSA